MQVSTLLLKIYGQWFHALGFSLCTTDHVYFDSRVIGSSQLEVKLKSLGSNTLCGVCCTYLAIFPSSRAAPRARCGLWSGHRRNGVFSPYPKLFLQGAIVLQISVLS